MRILLFPTFLPSLPYRVSESTLFPLRLEIEPQQILVRRHRVDVLGLEPAGLNDILIVAHALVLLLLLFYLQLPLLHYFGILEDFPVTHLAEAQRLHQDHLLLSGNEGGELCLDVFVNV